VERQLRAIAGQAWNHTFALRSPDFATPARPVFEFVNGIPRRPANQLIAMQKWRAGRDSNP